MDRQFSPSNSAHLNLTFSRSWFQTPNTYDNLQVQNVTSGGSTANPVFTNVGNTDQKNKIETFNIAPTFTHIVGANGVFNFSPYIRHDAYNYYPSKSLLADLGPVGTESIAQQRQLTNAGIHTEFSYIRGRNTIKAGAVYSQTFLREHDQLGLVDSTFRPVRRRKRCASERLQ